jgi:ribonuclease VapC
VVVDTSALLAILLGEAEAATFARAIATGGRGLVSSFSLLEAGLVIESRKGAVGARELDLLVARAGLECVALSPEQAELAREAWRRYGKGRHPAALNIGDCCSYALARYTGEPLLFKGGDFSLTDIAAVAVDASPGS